MIKDFEEIVKRYFTPEEEKQYIGIGTRGLLIKDEVKEEHSLTAPEQAKLEFTFMNYQHAKEKGKPYKVEAWEEEYFKKLLALAEEAEALYNTARDRYKEDRKREGILEDIASIIEAYTKEDYLAQLNKIKKTFTAERLSKLPSERMKEEFSSLMGLYTEENYRTCFSFCFDLVEEPIMQLLEPEDVGDAVEIIKARVALWYEPEPLIELPEAPELPNYDFVYPTELQQNLTKASTTIFSSKNSIEALKQIAVEISPNRKGLTTTYTVDVDLTAPELKGTENITEYDKSVHNMAVSIAMVNKYGGFTAKQVATALYHGNNHNSNISKQQIGAVTKSIEKQALIRLTIDWTDHIKLNNGDTLPEDVTNYKKTGYMLPVEGHTFTIKGQELHGYRLIAEPPLYQYARSVGQIGQHPIKMLNVPVNLDQSKIVIRDFLLEEISHLKNPSLGYWGKTISVDRLLTIAGEDSQQITRKKKSLLLSSIIKMLEYWKDEKYIKDFKLNRKAKTIQSFTIEA